MEKTFHPGKNVICLSCSALSLAQRYGSVPTKNWDIIPLLLSYFLFLRDTNFPYWWGARRTHYIFKSQIIIPCTGENGDKLFMLAILIIYMHACVCSRAAPIQIVNNSDSEGTMRIILSEAEAPNQCNQAVLAGGGGNHCKGMLLNAGCKGRSLQNILLKINLQIAQIICGQILSSFMDCKDKENNCKQKKQTFYKRTKTKLVLFFLCDIKNYITLAT